jgi:hypothetical protein
MIYSAVRALRIASVLACMCIACARSIAEPIPSESSDGAFRLLATFDLAKLSAQSAELPTAYCERTDLVYDLSMTARANWSSATKGDSHALFTLGRNMHGQQPNSVSLMVWEGQKLFARMTSSTMADTAQVITNAEGIHPGTPVSIHVRWNRNTISLDYNGIRVGESTMAGDFLWPHGRPYFVGLEDVNYTPWSGPIDQATLRVYEPKIQAAFANGNSAGYYLGHGPHQLGISLPRGDGKAVTSRLSIDNIDGSTVAKDILPTRTDSYEQDFTLPPLPFGWYLARVTVSRDNANLAMSRSMAISPSKPERDISARSPFGIANEADTRFATYSPDLTEDSMARLEDMGVRWYRFWLPWSSIQTTPDSYEWRALDDIVERASKHGLTLYVCLVGGTESWQSYEFVQRSPYPIMSHSCYMPRDLDQWETYVTALVKRYRGKISNYQVWNEPDARNGFFPFHTQHYVSVVRATYQAIKAVDPSATVGLGGFAGGFGANGIGMLTHTDKDAAWGLGEFWALHPQAYYDVMDCHFYSTDQPEQSWDSKLGVALNLRRAMDANGDGAKPLWNSETSFLTGDPGKIGGWANVPLLSGKDQAARLVQMHIQSLAAGIAHTMWYSVRGDCGVVNSDFSPLPAYAAHAELARLLKGATYDGSLGLGPSGRGYDFKIGERHLSALWTTAGSLPLTVTRKATLIDIWGNESQIDTGTKVEVSTIPQYVASDGDAPVVSSDAQVVKVSLH